MKSCEGCTACCNGTLSAMIGDHPMHRGNPCIHMCSESNNCKIYEDRPDLCKNFHCLWLLDETMPDWLKPSQSGVILIYRPTEDETLGDGILHVHVVEGMEVNASTLMHLLYWCCNNNWTGKFHINGRGIENEGYLGAMVNFKQNYFGMQSVSTEEMYERTYNELLQRMKDSKENEEFN